MLFLMMKRKVKEVFDYSKLRGKIKEVLKDLLNLTDDDATKIFFA